MAKPLDLDRLKRFEPTSSAQAPAAPSRQTEVDANDRWPSREPVMDGQISIKGPLASIRRFKAMCKADRRTYIDMLDILMNKFEDKA